jgi:hypothetical protein
MLMKACSHDPRAFLAAGISAAIGLAARPAVGQSQDLTGLTRKKGSDLLRSKATSAVDL